MRTFTGKEYLKIDIASTFGLDKKTWQERLDWFHNNELRLEEMIHLAKEPALYYAGVKAYRDVQKGRPTGYMISLDATASGLQLLSVLTGDKLAAKLCNVIDTGDREDAYVLIYEEMCRRINDAAKISREGTKQAIMTSLYSSKAVPKEVFGEGALLDTFYGTISDMAPGAWELNEAMVGLWNPDALSHDWVLPDNFHVQVKVMSQVRETVHFLNEPFDTFKKVNAPTDEGRSLGANTIHSIDGMIVREMTRRCSYDATKVNVLYELCVRMSEGAIVCGQKLDDEDAVMVQTLWDHYKASGFLSARILDHLWMHNISLVDPEIVLELLRSLPHKPFTVISIHDCFRCLPNYGNDLRKQYNLLLSHIAKSNLLGYMISQIVGQKVSIGKLNANMAADVLVAEYALS